jgi:hypothetical protein
MKDVRDREDDRERSVRPGDREREVGAEDEDRKSEPPTQGDDDIL